MFTANVSGQGGTPTGDVTFSEGATTLGVSQLTNGVATLAKSDLSAGAHTIVATYGGDATFETSSASHNHTVSSSQCTSTPTGTVTFLEGAATLGTGQLNASGVATLNLTTLAVGTHSVTARYEGDQFCNQSTSAAVEQRVNSATSSGKRYLPLITKTPKP